MIAALLRVITLPKVSQTDIPYTACDPLLWSFLEASLGITVACAPLMGPLINAKRILQSLSNKSSGRGERDFERRKDPANRHQLADLPAKKTAITTTTASTDDLFVIQSPSAASKGRNEDSDDMDDGGKFV